MKEALLFLMAALVAVPIAVRIGLGSVLGYLFAGVVIGPVGLSLVSDPKAILHLSELGVVLMLFVIGLELEPRRLWSMRGAVFGGGALQMAVCAALMLSASLVLGWRWQSALIASLSLALSSTAVVVAILQERHLMALPLGRSAFSILLFQDIAAIPLLALVAALGTTESTVIEGAQGSAEKAGLLMQVAAIVGVVLAGRYLAYPAMRLVARMQVRELFTAFALLLVLGVAALMEFVGLSMGLGAFIAGVLLAGSEYRHALENDILPFKGLLLGLFFIAVGMSMQLGLVVTAPLQVATGLILVVALKSIGLWLLAPRLNLAGESRTLLAVLLSQVGEFAFVVIAAAKSFGTLPSADADLLMLIAALSMVTTPLLLIAYDRWLRRPTEQRPVDQIEQVGSSAIVAGFGRYGQTVARVLLGAGIKPTVIDHDADTVDSARRFGFKVYFGDATQPDLLHAAGIELAKVVIVAIDDVQQTNRLVHEVRTLHPHVRIVVRAHDALHAISLLQAGAHKVEREVFESSLRSARAALEAVGHDRFEARQLADHFRRHSELFLSNGKGLQDSKSDLISRVRQARMQFEHEIQEELQERGQRLGDRAWQPEAHAASNDS
ncbi:monovalent cation:proton antiporter-2 (CPA2) family protein [Pseudomonas aeruginosa]|nr:monovalent cation:proton antiporter-2 (CPA2) family protein [Pseudomonas aeruginosa]MCS8829182.1 monovalent cation:proton antiporter-2 (CPA2) family protein [Pseudomonas aeruginosa]MCS8873997.1 monovalent cation:proton antiporter-2 (CPA2) family protein [Pseudomonas aeruginosa]MCS8908005.1 monovalent cation:proton antiporter-2 (CPA2) family protein [Pseudomonas aeruginosa]MCS8914056.1 monovalent cation:proton antiporter-2 (CPA2) family protein [Pseudomonas aeruginosa]